jgi:CBS domain-containing protein
MPLTECTTCQHVHRVDEHEIDCSPPVDPELERFLAEDPRLGGDALVGEAMGTLALSTYVDTPAGELARAMAHDHVRVAIVIDRDDRVVGLVEGPDVEAAPPEACLHGIVRQVAPVHERSRLASTIQHMVKHRARALPVVDDAGRPAGILSDLDALRWVSQSGRR